MRESPGYNILARYCRTRSINCTALLGPEAYPCFETPWGYQLQLDWKESLKMVEVNGGL